jgi:site-specific DNA-methyltransferase (adenine-specific)
MKVHEIGPRHNKDGSKTKAKVIVTKAFNRLQDFFNSRTYFDIIETATASADCAFLNKQYQIEHKAPFPLQLPLYSILSCSDEGDTVLDMCMGSGTTAVASMLMGRIAVGYECEKTFHDLATQRCIDIEVGLEELNEERKKSA